MMESLIADSGVNYTTSVFSALTFQCCDRLESVADTLRRTVYVDTLSLAADCTAHWLGHQGYDDTLTHIASEAPVFLRVQNDSRFVVPVI